MGNCLTSSAHHSNFLRSQAVSSTPGTSGSQFSAAGSVDVSESCPSGKILDQPNLKEFSFTELKLITRNSDLHPWSVREVFGRCIKAG
uniref:Uncharacterized protein n=1 Tax=Cucumis sativus TaxID=3659 RepID=A0A0A0L4T4_CUCSA